jgi:plastocyanin
MSPTASAAALAVRLLTVEGKPVAGAVLTLRATQPERTSAAPVKAVMDQQQRSFVPHVLIVPLNSTVTFPNSDSVSHQVYSFSPAKRFQLPLYHGSPNPPVQFDRAGVITLGCNIHDAMRAYIFVVDGQYFGRSDATGLWNVAAVEPGDYEVQAWHPLARELLPFIEKTLTIQAGTQPQRMTLQAAAPLRLRPESTVPANWDAY